MMDPFVETVLIGVPMLIVLGAAVAVLLPKIDLVLGRLSDHLDDRKDRRAAGRS